ncbi:MAG: PQQ-binding-like beta-propeller repeat protein [Acidobacteriota bacterium]
MNRRIFCASSLLASASSRLLAQSQPGLTQHRQPRALDAKAVTEEWPCFLGPGHNGFSKETNLIKTFPASGPPLVWERNKGTGYSSASVAGGKLVFLHRMNDREIVECLQPESGEQVWQFDYATKFEDRYGYNNGPRASPVIEGDRVFTFGAEGKLHCLQLATGKVIWKKDLQQDFHTKQDFFGVASTPLLEGRQLIVTVGAPGGPTVASFDTTSGELNWSAGKEWGASYASPIPATVNGKRRIFVFAGGESQPPTGGLIVIDPANGAIDFSFPWRSKSYESVNASCPVISGNLVFVSASYRTGGAMLEISPDMKFKTLWTSAEFGMHFNTPIFKDGYLYGFDGRNEPDASLACVEAKTGKVMWRTNPEWKETIPTGSGSQEQMVSTYRGNLLHVGGRFLALGELGHLIWMDLTPRGYQEGSRAWLFAARETWSLPVLSRGLLYVMQHTRDALHNKGPRLLCYDMRA